MRRTLASRRTARTMARHAVLALLCVTAGVAAPQAAAFTKLVQKPDEAGCVTSGTVMPCALGRGLAQATSVAISPDGANAYVASNVADALAVFDRAADGTLTQKAGAAGCLSDAGTEGCTDIAALDGPTDVVTSLDGKSVYLATSATHAIAVFDRAADGTLTQKPGAAGCISDLAAQPCTAAHDVGSVSSVIISHDGTSLYTASAINSTIARFERATDGTLMQQPDTTGCLSDAVHAGCTALRRMGGPTEMALSSDDRNMYVSARSSASIAILDRAPDDSLTQKLGHAGCIESLSFGDLCATLQIVGNPISVAMSPDDANVYFTQLGGVTVFDRAADGTIALKPGVAGCVSSTPAPGVCMTGGLYFNGASSLTVSPDGANAYLTAATRDVTSFPTGNSPAKSGVVAVFERAADGALTPEPGFAGCIEEGTPRSSCTAGRGLVGASSAAVSPNGANVYVTGPESGAVAALDRAAFTPPPVVPPPPSVVADPAPVSTRLTIRPTRFRPSATRSSVASSSRLRGGGRVSFRLSEPATVRFGVQRALAGWRAGGRCVRVTRSNRRAKRCIRYVSLQGTFSVTADGGDNTFAFTGRLRRHALAAGRYRLRGVARDSAQHRSRTRVVGFNIRGR